MRLQSLTHLVASIRALCAPRRIVILGSAALLANFPEISGEDGPMENTLDGGFLLDPTDAQIAAILKESIGDGSIFFNVHGYYADCLRPEIAETFPAGWEARLVPLEGYADVFALDPYDVALVKLVVGRKKISRLWAGWCGLGNWTSGGSRPATARRRWPSRTCSARVGIWRLSATIKGQVRPNGAVGGPNASGRL